MANELSLVINLSFSKGGAKVTRQFSKKVDIAGDAFTHGVQQIGTTEEEVAQGSEVGDPGWVLIINLDDTNYIEVGALTGEYTVKILKGEFALYRHALEESSTILAKANSGNVNIEYFIFEN